MTAVSLTVTRLLALSYACPSLLCSSAPLPPLPLQEASLAQDLHEEQEDLFNQYAAVCVDTWARQGKSTVPMNILLSRKPRLADFPIINPDPLLL